MRKQGYKMAKIYNIAVIKGDGIGPEIVDEAVRVLDAASVKHGFELNYNFYLMGGAAIDVFGEPLPSETLNGALATKRLPEQKTAQTTHNKQARHPINTNEKSVPGQNPDEWQPFCGRHAHHYPNRANYSHAKHSPPKTPHRWQAGKYPPATA